MTMPNLNIHIGDGRLGLEQSPYKYDIIAVDAYRPPYIPAHMTTQEFFQIIQNKLHWAASRKTAAELIAERADHEKPNMGLTSWKGAKVRKADVTIAKNYLYENEIAELNRIVSMYLVAEDVPLPVGALDATRSFLAGA